MGLGSLRTFVTMWVVMMAAMMLLTAMPLAFASARNVEGRQGWRAATGALGLSYLSVWLLFGLLSYAALSVAHVP